MKKTLILFFTALILTARGTKNTANAPESFTQTAAKGLAIGTITFEGDVPVNDMYRFFYEGQTADKKFNRKNGGKIAISGRTDGKSTFNGDFNDKKTYLFVIEAEPGAYAFTKYNYLDHVGPQGILTDSDNFTIPFEVKAGQIAYIGELAYVDKAAPGDPKIFVADYFTRDLPEFKKKYPTVNWDQTNNITPKTGNTGNGIIDFRG
jgi:hypothetical protein